MGKHKLRNNNKSLIKSKARVKALGEVFTPPELVGEMLGRLPSAVLTNPAKTFLEPSCGTGNFLVAILEEKLRGGSNVMQALATTYGIDICPDNVNTSRKRLLDAARPHFRNELDRLNAHWLLACNIVVGDALKEKPTDILCRTEDQRMLRRMMEQRPLCWMDTSLHIVGDYLLGHLSLQVAA